jgi:hypothetical protein
MLFYDDWWDNSGTSWTRVAIDKCNITEIREWCVDFDSIHKFTFRAATNDTVWWFQNECDALIFTLRWT